MKRIANNLILILVALFLMVPMDMFSADIGPADLSGEDKEHYDRFRYLFMNGSADEFYSFVNDYEEELKGKGYIMLYYKLKSNKGFYALRHNMLDRAIKVAEDLDVEMRRAGASQFFYLVTALMGDIYRTAHDFNKAEKYFIQALAEADDRDPKFSMRTYHCLGEMMYLKAPQKSLEWINLSLDLAKKTENIEYEGLAKALTAYIYFLGDNSVEFNRAYDDYQKLRNLEKPGFNHSYDNILEVAKLSFDGEYQKAMDKLKQGNVYVDSSLVAIRILALEKDVDGGFRAMKRRYVEMDSLFGIIQDASYNHRVTESENLKLQQEVQATKNKAKTLKYCMIGLAAFFIFSYLMGRRRLFLKLRDRTRDLRTALAHAEEADHMKAAFISNMSHEIRTPLNAVAGFTEVICQPGIELDEEEKKDMKERISINVELITSIVNELLELSKSESESALRPDSEMSDVMINTLCRKLLRSMVTSTSKGVETRFSTNVADDFLVRTKPTTLSRILTHLINNAQKFTESGYIELRCELDATGREIRLIVKDTGIGIKLEDQSRIFELFEKASGNFKEGIGLGLPISQRLASSIGAEISIDPEYTDGSRFILTIPMK